MDTQLDRRSNFYGSSVNSYWDEDDVLEKELFEAMFVDDLTKVTPMFDKAKLDFVAHYGGAVSPGTTLLRYLECTICSAIHQ